MPIIAEQTVNHRPSLFRDTSLILANNPEAACGRKPLRRYHRARGGNDDARTTLSEGAHPDAAIKDAQDFAAAFPDVAGAPQLVLASKDTVAGLAVIAGTHGGPLPGPGDKPIAATNMKIGYMFGLVTDIADGGVAKERQYADNTTLLAQLGVIKAPTRPVMTAAAAAPTVVVSTGSDTERANVETFRANMTAFNARDVKTLTDMNTADGVFHDYTQPKLRREGQHRRARRTVQRLPRCETRSGHVVGRWRLRGDRGHVQRHQHRRGAVVGMKKPSGKSAKVRFLEITKIEGGKIKEDWLVFDSAAFAGQLGL